MRCIFCKSDSSMSVSVEHIVPESLGNVEHTLPPGVVCDSCNNYIAREVEKPFLDSPYIVRLRHEAGIPNKRGRIPLLEGWCLPSGIRVVMGRDPIDDSRFVGAASNRDETAWVTSMLCGSGGSLLFSEGKRPDPWTTTRFLAKIGLEVLASRVVEVPGGLDEIVEKTELDELREHARRGENREPWPFAYRQIYAPDTALRDGGDSYTVAHEFDILVTEEREYFIVFALFGDELVLNLGGRCIRGYHNWLRLHGGASPLYSGRNS